MMEDCSIGLPETVIYHHHRPELRPRPVSAAVKNIGYEGSPRYIGGWLNTILDYCEVMGWNFHVNTLPVDQLDIVVAVRDTKYRGYAQKHWKSNVKLANAHAAGAPFIGQDDYGYTETGSGMELYVSDKSHIIGAFELLSSYPIRAVTASYGLSQTITLDQCANQVREFLATI
jgi:hypothetical protein